MYYAMCVYNLQSMIDRRDIILLLLYCAHRLISPHCISFIQRATGQLQWMTYNCTNHYRPNLTFHSDRDKIHDMFSSRYKLALASSVDLS